MFAFLLSNEMKYSTAGLDARNFGFAIHLYCRTFQTCDGGDLLHANRGFIICYNTGGNILQVSIINCFLDVG